MNMYYTCRGALASGMLFFTSHALAQTPITIDFTALPFGSSLVEDLGGQYAAVVDGNGAPARWDPVNGTQALSITGSNGQPLANYGVATGVSDSGVTVGLIDFSLLRWMGASSAPQELCYTGEQLLSSSFERPRRALINNQGHIAGHCYLSFVSTEPEAFRYDDRTGFTSISALFGGSGSSIQIEALNDQDQVAGYSTNPSTFVLTAFAHDPVNGLLTLPNLPPAYSSPWGSMALGNNNNGDVVGWSEDAPVLWRNGEVHDLRPTSTWLTGYEAIAINDLGMIALNPSPLSLTQGNPFLLVDGVLIELDVPLPFGNARITDIDNAGNVSIGNWWTAGGGGALLVQTGSLPEPYRRGDVNQDGNVDITDAVLILESLFGGATLNNEKAADTNDDGNLDVADAVLLLNYLFVPGSDAPAEPFTQPGLDMTASEYDYAYIQVN